MFIAMNRFKVIHGSEADFETVWTSRDTHLRDVPGLSLIHISGLCQGSTITAVPSRKVFVRAPSQVSKLIVAETWPKPVK